MMRRLLAKKEEKVAREIEKEGRETGMQLLTLFIIMIIINLAVRTVGRTVLSACGALN